MKTKVQHRVVGAVLATSVAVATTAMMLAAPAWAHHSFAAYNMEVTKVFTGVVTRVNPDANHLQIFFAPMNEERKNVIRGEDGKPIIWAVEMAGSAQAAKEGISVNTFPPGTIFSMALHPLRDGRPAGTRGREGVIFKCPGRKPPAPGKHCDSVEGHTQYGTGSLPPEKKE
ncbi:MAG: hypothetical protein IRZ28_20060 [Steroidobacteraceae bacterium]|nr:hypothetical protein [Steroidobacteraceae bacterium]